MSMNFLKILPMPQIGQRSLKTFCQIPTFRFGGIETIGALSLLKAARGCSAIAASSFLQRYTGRVREMREIRGKKRPRITRIILILEPAQPPEVWRPGRLTHYPATLICLDFAWA